MVSTVVNELSRTALESALRCDYIVLRKQINFQIVFIRSENLLVFKSIAHREDLKGKKVIAA